LPVVFLQRTTEARTM